MFDRTIRMLEKCKNDARAFAYFCTLITQSFFLIYYIGALCLSFGHPIIYGVLLSLTAAALLFFIFTESPHDIKPMKMRRWIRIFIRYAKYCVHLIAISVAFYSFYAESLSVSPMAILLLVVAILAFFIQIIGEIVGFLSRRYFEELLASALADTELLRSLLDKVQSSANTIRRMKEGLSSIPDRAAQKASAWGAKIKKNFSFFKRRKKEEPPLLADIVLEVENEGEDAHSIDTNP